jgi:hypothetical protein
MRFVFLSLCLLLCSGCGANSGSAPKAETEAGEGLNQLRDLMVEAAGSGPPLKKKGDLADYEGRYPAAVAGVNDGSLTVVWGKGIREGIGENAKVIAYQTTPVADGTWAVLENSEIKKLSADELKTKSAK